MEVAVTVTTERSSKSLWRQSGAHTPTHSPVHRPARSRLTEGYTITPEMASFTIFRVGRFLRSIMVPTIAVIGFSFLLTFVFVLYQPTPGPGSIQHLGWQAWDIVTETNGNSNDTLLDISNETVPAPSGQDSGVDWWDVTTANTGAADLSSLPLDVWDPLMPHDTGCKLYYIAFMPLVRH